MTPFSASSCWLVVRPLDMIAVAGSSLLHTGAFGSLVAEFS